MTFRRRLSRRAEKAIAAANDAVCRASGKRRFSDERTARQAALQVNRSADDFETFRCRRCGDWHFGHRRERA